MKNKDGRVASMLVSRSIWKIRVSIQAAVLRHSGAAPY